MCMWSIVSTCAGRYLALSSCLFRSLASLQIVFLWLEINDYLDLALDYIKLKLFTDSNIVELVWTEGELNAIDYF